MNINLILDILLVILTSYVLYELVIKKELNKKNNEIQQDIIDTEVQLSPEALKIAKEETLYRLYSSFQVQDLSKEQAQELLLEKIKEKPLTSQVLIDKNSGESYEEQIEALSRKYEAYSQNLKKGLKPDSAFEKALNTTNNTQ